MLRAMKQRALSAADPVTNSSRDSPTISLSGKGGTPHPPASCRLGHRVRGGTRSLHLCCELYWKHRAWFSPSLSILAERAEPKCKLEGGREGQGRALTSTAHPVSCRL